MDHHAREALLKRAETIKILPTPVGIANRTLAAIQQPECSFDNLFNIIKDDLSISSKLLSLANSAFFKRGHEINSLKRAMVAVGFRTIKEFLACTIFYDGILKGMKLGRVDTRFLWGHSCYVAYAARMLAEEEGYNDPEQVFTFALLHDIGKVLFCLLIGRTYRITMRYRTDYGEICSREEECFGIDHQEMGCVLARRWEMPEELVELIGCHHTVQDGNRVINLVEACNEFTYLPMIGHARNDREAFLLENNAVIKAEVQKINEMLL